MSALPNTHHRPWLVADAKDSKGDVSLYEVPAHTHLQTCDSVSGIYLAEALVGKRWTAL